MDNDTSRPLTPDTPPIIRSYKPTPRAPVHKKSITNVSLLRNADNNTNTNLTTNTTLKNNNKI